ncbi:hypothetical protein D3C73_1675260 [compost metagenome]
MVTRDISRQGKAGAAVRSHIGCRIDFFTAQGDLLEIHIKRCRVSDLQLITVALPFQVLRDFFRHAF